MNRYLTLGPRLAALIIDFVVFLPLVALYIWLPFSELSPVAQIAVMICGSVINLSYNILLHWKYGQTVGKMFMKIKVVDAESEGPITFRQAFLRDIAYVLIEIIEFFVVTAWVVSEAGDSSEAFVSRDSYTVYLIYLWLAIDILVCIKSSKNRALHDLIAGTVVVRLDVPAENESGRQLDPPGPEAYAGLGANTD